LLAADAELTNAVIEGARQNATADNFNIVDVKTYQMPEADFAAIVRELQAANADVVFVAANEPDTVGIVRALNASGLTAKLLGGPMTGLQATSIKSQLGPLLNGIITAENFVPASTLNFSGLADLLKRYRAAAAGEQVDPLGYEVVPFGYAAGQVLAQAVEATHSLDPDKLAEYMHTHKFETVVGNVEYGKNGEWAEARTVFAQYQHLSANSSEQFADGKLQPILWPQQFKTGEIIYPYADAKK
jgi:branched-chain amino acid transport system substrate-binding protein